MVEYLTMVTKVKYHLLSCKAGAEGSTDGRIDDADIAVAQVRVTCTGSTPVSRGHHPCPGHGGPCCSYGVQCLMLHAIQAHEFRDNHL